ncbi:tyrosine-type recombinase/integrase [Microbacterium sp. LWH11-1.2]|uniref:tyrosine-type recombinase/integrase n=1 Tax=Microbacterium sp. LWH11-1.2 TaxID=3135258 RepID=UPI0031389137
MASRARSGDGAQYKEKSSGLWAVAIELPPIKWHSDGTPFRNRKVQRFRTRAEADTALRELREQKRQMGTLPSASPTVETWFAKWLKMQVIPNKRPKTAKTYEQYVRSYIVPALGASTLLSKVTPDTVRRIEAFVIGQGLSPSTATNAYHYASAGLEFAVRQGALFFNPAKRVEPPRKAVPDLDVFTLSDADRLLKYLEDNHHPDLALWATYLLTGARRSEIAGLEIDRIGDTLDLSWQLQRLEYTHGCGGTCSHRRAGNCPERVLQKPHDYEVRQIKGGMHLTRPKSRAGWRIIPLVDPLRRHLLQYIAQAPANEWGLVFATKHGRYKWMVPPDPDRITHEWPKIRDEVFGPGRRVRLHDIRHTAVDLLYRAGVREEIIQEIIGHSTRAMTRAYRSRTEPGQLEAGMVSYSAQFMRPETVRTHEIES